MTEHLKLCESASTPAHIHKAALKYVLEEFHSNPDVTESGDFEIGYLQRDGQHVIQKMFDKSSAKMRIYGSAKELAENIKIFKSFPGSHRYFEEELEPYFTTPIIYHSLTNEKFICKSDIFSILQSMIVRVFPSFEKIMLFLMVKLHLNSKENRIRNVEFVRFDEKVFDEIWDKVKEIGKEVESIRKNPSFQKLIQDCSTTRPEDMVNKMKSAIPIDWNMPELHRALYISLILNNDLGIKNNPELPLIKAARLVEIKTIVKCIEGIISERPEMFLPSVDNKLRMFEDGNQKFVMNAELRRALKDAYNDPKNIYETTRFELVRINYPNRLSHIEFIRCPIKRAKHKAVLVNGANSTDPKNFCILAVDVLLEFLRGLIIGKQAFQKCSEWPQFSKLFEEMEEYFKTDCKDPYFLKVTSSENLRLIAQRRLKSLESKPAKLIRNAKSDGFTVQNLKNELAHLGLTVTFPEIQDHAEVVYAHVDKVKKEMYLRTCDLIDAVEMCQLICVFERLPKYKKFLHNQGGCGRVPGLKCQNCNGFEEKSAAPGVPEPSKSTKILPEPKQESLKYKGTNWTFYGQNDVQMGKNGNANGIFPLLICGKSVVLYSSLNVYLTVLHRTEGIKGCPKTTQQQFDEISRNAKMFILDKEDLEWTRQNYEMLWSQVHSKNGEKPFLNDIATFVKHHQKHFYIRTVTNTAINADEHCRVFTDDVIEVLGILSESQNIEKYQTKWKTDHGRLTIDLKELKEVLEELDIDKRRISIFPDLSNSFAIIQSMLLPGIQPIFVHFEKSEKVLSTSQAIFMIFQSIICDIDWNKDPCKKHSKCMEQYKSLVMLELKKLISLPEGLYIPLDQLENRVKTLKTSCNYQIRKDHLATPLVKLFDLNLSDSIPASFFLSESKTFGLRYHHPTPESAIIPVWKARILFMIEWMDSFFGSAEHDELRSVIRRAMLFRAPCPSFESEEELMDLVLGLSPEKQGSIEQMLMVSPNGPSEKHEWMKVVKDSDRKYVIRGQSNRWNDQKSLIVLREIWEYREMEKAKKSTEKSEKIDGLAGNLESMKIENPVLVAPKNLEIPDSTQDSKPQDQKADAPPPVQAPPIPAPKESKNCQKCYRTCEMLNETKKELTRNEQKMKKLEKKLGEIKGENTKEIGKKNREMEEFNRKIQKSTKENEELKGRIEGLEVAKQQLEKKLGRQEQAAHESELKLTEQISLLEISLKNESEKSLQLQNEIQISRQNAQNSEVLALEKQQLEQQIGAQNQKIHEFYDSNIRLQAENEINSRMVQQLLDKLASYSNPTGYSNPGGPSNYSTPTSTYSNPTNYSNPNSGSSGHSNPTTYSNPNGPSGSSDYSKLQCQVCRLEMKPEDQRYCRLIKCQQCGLKLHTSCATNWISAHKTCPSCQGQFLKN